MARPCPLVGCETFSYSSRALREFTFFLPVLGLCHAITTDNITEILTREISGVCFIKYPSSVM